MRPYATDSNERRVIPLLLVGLSVLFAWLLNRTFQELEFSLPWWIDAPSVVGFYGVFYTAFERYLWRLPILRATSLVKVPDLAGSWKGYVVSSFNAHGEKHEAAVEIRQSWTRISINLRTRNSKSHSLTASLLTENQNAIALSYEYLNEPRANGKATMHVHRGTARLTLSVDGQHLEGEYYSGRDRQNFGLLSLRRL